MSSRRPPWRLASSEDADSNAKSHFAGSYRLARMRVSEGTYTRFGRYEPAELVRKFVEVVSSVAEMVRRFVEVIRNFVEIVIIFAEVIRKIVEMVTGCTELVGRGVGVSVGCDGLVGRGVWVPVVCGERMVRTLGNSVGVAIS